MYLNCENGERFFALHVRDWSDLYMLQELTAPVSLQRVIKILKVIKVIRLKCVGGDPIKIVLT